jgi:hypothetical protein
MPKIEVYTLYNAVRQAKEHPELAGDYFMATAVLGILYFCRRFVFSAVVAKFPTTILFFTRLSSLVGIIIITGGAAFLIIIAFIFCSNLFGDIAARM